MRSITDILVGFYEVNDRRPSNHTPFDAVVVMSIAPLDDKSIGSAIGCLLNVGSFFAKPDKKIIISNRFEINGKRLMDMAINYLVWMEPSNERRIIVPSPEENRSIRNTFMEALFAVKECKKRGFSRILVVANHIHMRRVLAGFRKAMQIENYNVEIFNIGDGHFSYGFNASCQKRFLHPIFFLFYEFLAYFCSKYKGWW